MKDLLFVIDTLNLGGAEKSLISLLNTIDFTKHNVDLLIFKRGGDLEKFIPNNVNILDSPDYFKFIHGQKVCNKIQKIKFLFYRIRTSIKLRINILLKNRKHNEQVVFASISNGLYRLEKRYDVAIAYSQGMPTYFVGNKVTAEKKLAWINIDYVKSNYDKEFDYKIYSSFYKIITVSKNTNDSMKQMKYNYSGKLETILDIVNPKVIQELADTTYPIEFKKDEFKILTVGRLDPIKRYDIAIDVAKMLYDSGYRFKWYAIGDGGARSEIEKKICQNGLEDIFILLGKKINPYVYMKNCDIYVQTSKAEGFGLTVIEAKILKKPIVCTNFKTAYELLNDRIDGIISDMDKESIYDSIKLLIDNHNTMNTILKNLEKIEPYSSVKEIEKFYTMINS